MQHFTAVDAPLDLNDVVMLSNDFAIGYFLYQKHEGHGLSAVVPTVEVHVNTPLNHRGVLGLTDPAGNPDLVDITSGIHFEFNDHSSVGVAFAMPVSGPRVFDFEILAQLRWRGINSLSDRDRRHSAKPNRDTFFSRAFGRKRGLASRLRSACPRFFRTPMRCFRTPKSKGTRCEGFRAANSAKLSQIPSRPYEGWQKSWGPEGDCCW